MLLKRFSKRHELLVAEAAAETTQTQSFNSNTTKDWPDWTKTIADLIVSRKLEVKIPVKTEFKLELTDISQNDIEIKDNVLTFKNPLTVKVDSQKEGGLEILSSSSGIIDKTVDVVTSNKKAMEFLDEKSQNAIYKTSNNVMAQEKYQKKVAKYASQDLEKLLNLKSDDKISVKINVSDLKFENIDLKNKKILKELEENFPWVLFLFKFPYEGMVFNSPYFGKYVKINSKIYFFGE